MITIARPQDTRRRHVPTLADVPTTSRTHIRPAFTLIEVLMAVLILAIGLLGLGAVLPMVVKQQRDSSDGTFGVLAMKSVETALLAPRPGGDEIQTLTIRPQLDSQNRSLLDGTFTLRFGGATTQNIPALATAEEVEAELRALLPIGDNCSVGLSVTTGEVRVYTFSFNNRLGRASLPLLAFNGGSLRGVIAPPAGGALVRTSAGGPDLSPEFFTKWAVNYDNGNLPPVSRNVIPPDTTWLPVLLDQNAFGSTELGTLEVYNGVNVDRRLFVPLAERFYPVDASGARAPQFVWDMAVRRITKVADDDWRNGNVPALARRVQVAIFMRRIDPRIATPRDTTMYAYFRVPPSSTAGPPSLWPVSVDQDGRPTLSGTTSSTLSDNYGYSSPLTLPVIFAQYTVGTEQKRDRLVLAANAGPRSAIYYLQASQPGQTLVDNLGNIYTVIGKDDRAPQQANAIRITPPVPTGIAETLSVEPEDPPTITQVLFTPQVPVAVDVFTINP